MKWSKGDALGILMFVLAVLLTSLVITILVFNNSHAAVMADSEAALAREYAPAIAENHWYDGFDVEWADLLWWLRIGNRCW